MLNITECCYIYKMLNAVIFIKDAGPFCPAVYRQVREALNGKLPQYSVTSSGREVYLGKLPARALVVRAQNRSEE